MSNFLWNPGTANNGQFTPYITLVSTELNSLPTGSGVITSVNGSAGIFTNVNTAQAIWGDTWLTNGTASITVTAGGNVAGWFLIPNNAGTYESPGATAATAPPRSPDFVIPMVGTAAAATVWKSNAVHGVMFPAMNFKIYVQNNTGATLNATGTTVVAGFVAELI